MRTLLTSFGREEKGQDLIEYTLLLAFVSLAAAGLFITAGESVYGIWTQASTKLSQANSAAQPS